jgi:AraC-like DNA-binding protein/ligand-binding sensor protein
MQIDPHLQRIVTRSAGLCAAALGTHAAILDSSLRLAGTFSHDDNRYGTLCKLVNAVPDGAAQCAAARERAARRAIQFGGPYFSACHIDLIEGVVPFRRNGTILAYALIGPIMLAPTDSLLTEKIVRKAAAFGIPQNEARQAIECIPVLDAERLKRVLNLLNELMSEINVVADDLGSTSVQEQPATAPPAPAPLRSPHTVAKSDSLNKRLALANSRVASASEIRQDVCDLISSKVGENFSTDRARAAALETVAGLWRALLTQDGNATVTAPTSRNLSALSATRTFGDALDWATGIIKRMSRESNPIPPDEMALLRQVRRYVSASLTERLSCAKVAREVGMQPHELDRMLQSRLDITFKQYLTLERLAYARKMLRESTMTATQIAAATGFNDQSNFTKVFEKVERITPIQYRIRSIAVKPFVKKRTSTHRHRNS